MTEQEFVAQVIAYLTAHGCFVWRQNQGAMRAEGRYVRFTSVEGVPDVVGLTKAGVFLAIECKRPAKRKTKAHQPKPHQAAFLQRVRARGGIALCVNSLDELRPLFEGD